MKTKMKRFLSLLLAASMVLSQVTTAFAEETIIIADDSSVVIENNETNDGALTDGESIVDDIIVEDLDATVEMGSSAEGSLDSDADNEGSSVEEDLGEVPAEGEIVIESIEIEENLDATLMLLSEDDDLATTSDAVTVTTEDELIDAVANGGKIVLGADITLTKSTNADRPNAAIVIASDKSVTLDLGEYTINVTGTRSNDDAKHLYAFDNYGTFVLEGTNGAINARGIENLGSGTMTINDGVTITAIDADGGAAIWNEADLTVNGGKFTTAEVSDGEYYDPGALNNSGTAVLNGGTFECKASLVYAIISSGSITVNDGVSVLGRHGALAVEGGSAVVNGGTFTISGVAEQTDNAVYVGAGSIVIKGGTFTNEGQNNSGSVISVMSDGDAAVEAGTFVAEGNAKSVSSSGTLAITGGDFGNADVSEYLADGYTQNEDGVINCIYAAKIGNAGYESLNAAIAAAEDGATITLLADTHTISGNFSKNLTFIGADKENCIIDLGSTVNEAHGKNLTFENLTIKRDNVNYKGFHHALSETYTNCIIEGSYWIYGTTANFTGCTFEQNDSKYYNIWCYGSATAVFKNCKFYSVGRSVLVYNEDGVVVNAEFTGCEFYASEKAEGKAAIEIDSSLLTKEAFVVTVSDCEAEGFDKGSVSGDTLYNNKSGDGRLTVTVDDEVKVEPIATVKNYDELVYALAEGKYPVQLTKDITATGVIDATNADIDLNGHTLTLAANNNFFGTSTISNGTICIDGVEVDGDCIIGIGDYSNDATLTLDEVNVVGTDYSSAYAVFYVYGSSTLNINGGSVVLNNDQASAGGVTKAEDGSNGKVNITGTADDPVELNFTDAKIGFLDGTVVMNYVDLDIQGGANAINQSVLTVKNSTLTISGCDGRALTLKNGDVVIENSTLEFSEASEGEIRFKAGVTMTLDENSNLSLCDVYADAGVTAAKVNDSLVTSGETYMGTVVVVNGEETVTNTWNHETITSVEDLNAFAAAVNSGETFAGKTVTLAADIDLNNEEFTPIGYMGATFKGTFEGGNHTIKNLKITKELTNTSANNGIGLFGRTDSPAVIQNFTIENADITGSLYVGAVVGFGYTGSKIENVTVKGDIAIDAWWYAGVIGGNGYMSLVNDCHVIGNEGSYVKGNDGSYIGGIWGFRGEGGPKITNCTVTNLDISGVDRVGGICGIGHYGNTISGCTAENVTVTATDPDATTVGLIVGACQGTESSPTVFENNTVTDVTAYAGETEVTNLYGTRINGTDAVTNYVAEIGGVLYTSLQAAVDEVDDDETIEILRNFTITTADKAGNAISDTSGKSYTIDLNGYTISADTGNAVFRYKNNSAGDAVVNLKNGTISAGENTYMALTVAKYDDAGSVTVNLSNLTIENSKSYGFAVKIWDGVSANVSNCTVNSEYGGGIYAAGGKVELSNVTVNQQNVGDPSYDAVALAVSSDGKMIVNSGTYTSDGYCIYMLNTGGTLTIKGGTFSNVDSDAYALIGMGAVEGAATAIKIYGGSFKTPTDIAFNEGGAGTATLKIYGGTYNVPVPEDYCGLGLTPYQISDGVYGVKQEIEAKIKSTGENYATLADALEAATKGDTIQLQGNVSVTELDITKDVTIDLNGYKLSFYSTNESSILGDVTITNGTIDVSNANAAGNCIIGVGSDAIDGTLTLEDVAVVGDGYSSAYAVFYVYDESELNIEGGSVNLSNDQSSAGGVFKAEDGVNGKINLTNTEINLTDAKIGFLDGTVVMDGVTLNIEGGANAINQSALTVKDSTITISNCDGRALTLYHGDVTIENSTLDFSGASEGEIRFKSALNLSIDEDSTLISCDVWSDVDGATVNGEAITGTEENTSTVTVADGKTTVENPAWQAMLNGVRYLSLAEALKTAKSGETVYLVDDVDLNNEAWTPISFAGNFDGDGHTISNLYINLPNQTYVGFFSGASGTIKNVTFENVDVTGKENVAAVTGTSNAHSFVAENIEVTGTIKIAATNNGYARAGVILGGWGYGRFINITVDGTKAEQSYVMHTGTGDGRYVAGIVGHADGVDEYTNCTVKNITISGGWLCGGIAGPGPADATVTGCVVENVTMDADYSGGLFGWYYAKSEGSAVIDNCKVDNLTFTDGGTKNGAIGGYALDSDVIVKNITVGTVTNDDDQELLSYAATIKKGDDVYYYVTLEDAVAAAEEGETITLLKDNTEFVVLPDGVTLDPNGFACITGSGTAVDPYVLDSLKELEVFRNEVNSGNTFAGQYVKLGADIDMSSVYNWTPIGSSTEKPFMGTFDGDGYTISNMKIVSSSDCKGLFGVIKGAVLENITINNVSIYAGDNVGAVVGMGYTGKIDNCHVTGIINIEGDYMVGGISGSGYAHISNCSVTGSADADENASYIKAVYSEENSEGDNVGGIVGYIGESSTTVTNCSVSNITITGTRKVGGVVGSAFQSNSITDVSVNNVVVGTNASAEYAESNVKTMGVGGLVGLYTANGNNNGTLTGTATNVTLTNANGVDASMGYITGGLRGTTSVEAPADTLNAEVAAEGTNTGATTSCLLPIVLEVGEGKDYGTIEAAIAYAKTQLSNDVTYVLYDNQTLTTTSVKYEPDLAQGAETVTIKAAEGVTPTLTLAGVYYGRLSAEGAKLNVEGIVLADARNNSTEGKDSDPWEFTYVTPQCESAVFTNVTFKEGILTSVDTTFTNCTFTLPDEEVYEDHYALWIHCC